MPITGASGLGKKNKTRYTIGDIRVGTVHRYKILETKVCIVSTLTSLGTLDDTFYKTVSILH